MTLKRLREPRVVGYVHKIDYYYVLSTTSEFGNWTREQKKMKRIGARLDFIRRVCKNVIHFMTIKGQKQTQIHTEYGIDVSVKI